MKQSKLHRCAAIAAAACAALLAAAVIIWLLAGSAAVYCAYGVLLLLCAAVVCFGFTAVPAGRQGEDYHVTENLPAGSEGSRVRIGKLHGIGARDSQQDCIGIGTAMGGAGLLAVVADGMGGLSDGAEVSGTAVMTALAYAADMPPAEEENPLRGLLAQVNQAVNDRLGPERQYKSGSTFAAACVDGDAFHWISVGDSRLYLYRAGFLNQLNRDHDLLQEWMPDILEGRRDYPASAADPEGRKLTSFLGMGELRYADASLQSIRFQPGDRLLLMSDGIYGTLNEETLTRVLGEEPDPIRAADRLGRLLHEAAAPMQDNYSLVILPAPEKEEA